jgi:hypothetical protein
VHDSTTTLSWSDVIMPQTRTLFMTTLVLAVTSLTLAVVLTGCVLCLILLPAYRVSSPFVLAESGINKRKWKWVFGLAVTLCFVALLFAFTLFLQLPSCFAQDSTNHCSTNECDSFIGGQRQKGGYLRIHTPFVGWGSAVVSCAFVIVVGTLFLAFFGRKRNMRTVSHPLATINAAEHSRREATPVLAEEDEDEDSGERRPLLASEKAERARKADSHGESLDHRLTVTKAPLVAEDATIDECDSPLAYHKPCPPSPSLSRMRPLTTLSSPRSPRASPRLSGESPRSSLGTHLTTITPLPAAAVTTEEQTPLEEKRKADAEREDVPKDAQAAGEARIDESATPGSESEECKEGTPIEETKNEEEKENDEQQMVSTEKSEERRKANEEVVAVAEEKEEAQPAVSETLSSVGGDAQVEMTSEEKTEEKTEERVEEKPEGEQQDAAPKPAARRAFATMQRMSYKDYAKKKAPPPTPESVLGPSRVRGVPSNRMALRSRGVPLSSVRETFPASPSRSATLPAASARRASPVAARLPVDDTEPRTRQQGRDDGEESNEMNDNAKEEAKENTKRDVEEDHQATPNNDADDDTDKNSDSPSS